ncbi:hypothetical protein F5Y16DRAFT_396097 [Xylariaceae sp. FL0255]|nr:hypothetical protein F5Y16DRAFT_396097 [Xylariaceae sp. FL0255]
MSSSESSRRGTAKWIDQNSSAFGGHYVHEEEVEEWFDIFPDEILVSNATAQHPDCTCGRYQIFGTCCHTITIHVRKCGKDPCGRTASGDPWICHGADRQTIHQVHFFRVNHICKRCKARHGRRGAKTNKNSGGNSSASDSSSHTDGQSQDQFTFSLSISTPYQPRLRTITIMVNTHPKTFGAGTWADQDPSAFENRFVAPHEIEEWLRVFSDDILVHNPTALNANCTCGRYQIFGTCGHSVGLWVRKCGADARGHEATGRPWTCRNAEGKIIHQVHFFRVNHLCKRCKHFEKQSEARRAKDQELVDEGLLVIRGNEGEGEGNGPDEEKVYP